MKRIKSPVWLDYIIHGFFLNFYGIFKYFPSPIGDLFRWIVLKVFSRNVRGVRIYEGVTFWYPYRIKIGSRVTLNEFVYLNGFGGLEIGDDVLIGKGTTIVTSDHVFSNSQKTIRSQGLIAKKVIIEDDVWIGANVTILGGVTIGRGSILAAGCVVTKNVDSYSVMGGVPAKIISKRG